MDGPLTKVHPKVRLYGTSEGSMLVCKSYINSEIISDVWSADCKSMSTELSSRSKDNGGPGC